MLNNPLTTTAADLCRAAAKEAGVIGRGQKLSAEDLADIQVRMQWMLQQWERKRWLVYHLVTLSLPCTGAQSYSIGPGADFDTGQFASEYGTQFATSARPNRLEAAFVRQITQSQPNQIDWPLEDVKSRENYNSIALKTLQSFPAYYYYDPAWPLGQILPWPVPEAAVYALYITLREQLPISFATAATPVELPFEYFAAILYNLAIRVKSLFAIPFQPGDSLVGLARDALNVIRTGNAQIPKLDMPKGLGRGLLYNIFSDRQY